MNTTKKIKCRHCGKKFFVKKGKKENPHSIVKCPHCNQPNKVFLK